MQTTPQFTWRAETQKKGKGKLLAAFAFVIGLVITHYWHVPGDQSTDLLENSRVATASGLTYTTAAAPSDTSDASPSDRLMPISPVIIEPSLESQHLRSTLERRGDGKSRRGDGKSKRKRIAATPNRKLKSEPDYAALREFLLKR